MIQVIKDRCFRSGNPPNLNRYRGELQREISALTNQKVIALEKLVAVEKEIKEKSNES